jgi:lipid-A-disaccharide synthase
MGKRVLIIAGEASGDLYGANLIQAMHAMDPDILFKGIGCQHMRETGMELLWDGTGMAVVGFTEVGRHLLEIVKAFQKVTAALRNWHPDLVVLIDYPEFNLLVAGKAKKLGIPVMYYVSPQIWAWRSGRIKTIRRRVDRMVVILPFEEPIYRKAGVKVSFVGHPLLDLVKVENRGELLGSSGSEGEPRPLVGLLPGSREGELAKLLPVMLDSGAILAARIPQIHFLLPLAPTIGREQVYPHLRNRDLPLTIVENNTHTAIERCDLLIAASGTVTLEAAILGTPVVVIYKVNPLTYWLGKQLIRVKHVSLANLVAGELLAPELLQSQARPERIAQEALSILGDEKRQAWIRKRLLDVRANLGSPGASEKAALIALELMTARA